MKKKLKKNLSKNRVSYTLQAVDPRYNANKGPVKLMKTLAIDENLHIIALYPNVRIAEIEGSGPEQERRR